MSDPLEQLRAILIILLASVFGGVVCGVVIKIVGFAVFSPMFFLIILAWSTVGTAVIWRHLKRIHEDTSHE